MCSKIHPIKIKKQVESRECSICNFRYLLTYIRYHEDRCGIRVNGKKLLPKNDEKMKIK